MDPLPRWGGVYRADKRTLLPEYEIVRTIIIGQIKKKR